MQVAPGGNAGKLRIEAPMEYFVVPDRFGNDLVADPQTLARPRAHAAVGPAGDGTVGQRHRDAGTGLPRSGAEGRVA